MAILHRSEALPDLLLIGRIDNRRIALSARLVERILPMVEVSAFPGAVADVLGLMNFHGAILPVVNLRPMFNLEKIAVHPDQHLVVVSTSRRYALWIDQAESVVRADPHEFEDINTPGAHASLVFRLAGEVLPVLSLAALCPEPFVGNERV